MVCIQYKGLIPRVSASVHPMTRTYFFNICSNGFSRSRLSVEEMIIGSVLFSPKYAYFRCASRALSSKVGGSSKDDFVFKVM